MRTQVHQCLPFEVDDNRARASCQITFSLNSVFSSFGKAIIDQNPTTCNYRANVRHSDTFHPLFSRVFNQLFNEELDFQFRNFLLKLMMYIWWTSKRHCTLSVLSIKFNSII